MTDFQFQGGDANHSIYKSKSVPVADTITMEGIGSTFTHCFLTAILYDGNGDPVAGTSGTVAVQVKPKGESTAPWMDPETASIDIADQGAIDWAMPTQAVKCVPTSIVGAVTWAVEVRMHRS